MTSLCTVSVSGTLLLCSIFLCCGEEAPDISRAKEILKRGRLAGLPEVSGEVHAQYADGAFTGDGFLKFAASAESIQKFIAESASVKDVQPAHFDEEHRYLALPRPPWKDATLKDTYFMKQGPDWFDPQIRQKGRKYVIDARVDQWGGYVVIDDHPVCLVG